MAVWMCDEPLPKRWGRNDIQPSEPHRHWRVRLACLFAGPGPLDPRYFDFSSTCARSAIITGLSQTGN